LPNSKFEARAVLKASAANPKWFDWPFDWLTAMSSVEWLTILSEVEGQIPMTEAPNSKT